MIKKFIWWPLLFLILIIFTAVFASIATSILNFALHAQDNLLSILKALIFGWIFPIFCYIFLDEKHKNTLQHIFCLAVFFIGAIAAIKTAFTEDTYIFVSYILAIISIAISYKLNNSSKLPLLRGIA